MKNNYINNFEKEQVKDEHIPLFETGDTLKVHVRIREGNKERIQVFEGLCIARHRRGVDGTFTVRKTSSGGIGVERIFPLYSKSIERIEVVRRGKVRRAKLYFQRERRGKAARIKERRMKKDS